LVRIAIKFRKILTQIFQRFLFIFFSTVSRFSACMETLEFVIYADGRVLEKVTGIVGASCAEVTAAIEAQLGQVLVQQPTSEFYAQAQIQASNSAAVSAQVNFSQW
jgi:hypothetical protein